MAKPQKRGDSWRIEIMVDGTRESATFRTKTEAVAWAESRKTRLREGEDRPRYFHDAIDKYIREVAPGLKGGRWASIRLDAIKRQIPDCQLSELSVDAFTRWRDQRLSEVKPGTVLREISTLRAVMASARRDWGWRFSDPLALMRKPSEPPPRDRIITNAEISGMLDALGHAPGAMAKLATQQVAVAFIVALETCMRSGEIVGLEWHRVDIDSRVAQLDKTKNGSRRSVPLSTRAIEALLQLPSAETRQGRLFDIGDATRDVLFRKARQAAGLSGFTFHDSRANAITKLAKVFDVLDLARITGHKDLKKLMIYYRKSAADLAKMLD